MWKLPCSEVPINLEHEADCSCLRGNSSPGIGRETIAESPKSGAPTSSWASPSFNEADNIAHVVHHCDEGLRLHFSQLSAVIINVDNNSIDDTEVLSRAPSLRRRACICRLPRECGGRGTTFSTSSRRLHDWEPAPSSWWMRTWRASRLNGWPGWPDPVLDHHFDYVTPLYARHEYDGTITNHVCYPLIRDCSERDIRQPIGGDFGIVRRAGRGASRRRVEYEHPPVRHRYLHDDERRHRGLQAGAGSSGCEGPQAERAQLGRR